jgi:hypothetical protein
VPIYRNTACKEFSPKRRWPLSEAHAAVLAPFGTTTHATLRRRPERLFHRADASRTRFVILALLLVFRLLGGTAATVSWWRWARFFRFRTSITSPPISRHEVRVWEQRRVERFSRSAHRPWEQLAPKRLL